MRVFAGTAEIAGYYRRLAAGLAEHGVACTRVELVEHPFSYGPADRRNALLRLVGWTARRRCAAIGRPLPVRLAWRAAQLPVRLPLLAWALARHDVFILAYGSSVAGPWELPVLRLLGKRVVHVFHGSDTRPPYLDGFLTQSGASPRRLRRLTRRTVRRLRWIERWTTVIMSHPASGQLHRRPFVAGLEVGIPIWSVAGEVVAGGAGGPGGTGAAPAPAGDRVRLLHSPSNPGVKGTELLRSIVAALQERGLPVDLVEISGRPNAEVRQALLACDLVLDQAYSDQPLAGFAAEAAAEGVGAVVGSHAAGDAGAPLPPGWPHPTAFVPPTELAATVERLVVDATARRELGAQAQAFVRDRWAPGAVAGRFLQLALGDYPREWVVDPAAITYPLGCGLSEERARLVVAALVGRYGPSVLGVDDKPELKARLLALAAEPARPPR